jgi:hypothetical protein
MGGTNYNASYTVSRIADSKATGKDIFAYSAAIASGAADEEVHELLDPSKPNSAGKLVRESFDSDVHPESVPVAVLFDVTASMGKVPRKFVEVLPNFMSMLVQKGYLKDPHILFGGIGDATCDSAPLQLGQFEGGNEMDDALTNIYLEEGGGGQQTESYELAMYYMARHTDLDSLKKRGRKGYLFIIGDETPYPVIRKNEVKRIIGDNLESDIRLSPNYDGWPRNSLQESYFDANGKQQFRDIEGDLLSELQEKFDVFFVMPKEGSYTNDTAVTDRLSKLFGQNFFKLDKAEDVCNLLCMIIGLNEGFDVSETLDNLKAMGASASSVRSVSTAVANYTPTRTAVAVASGTLPSTGKDSVTRL